MEVMLIGRNRPRAYRLKPKTKLAWVGSAVTFAAVLVVAGFQFLHPSHGNPAGQDTAVHSTAAATLAAAVKNTQPYTVSVKSVGSLSMDKTAALTATFHAATRRSNLIVDVVVYDNTGRQVDAFVQPDQTLKKGDNAYHFSWTPAASGTYRVQAGVFTARWKRTLYWNRSVAVLSVGDGTAATGLALNAGSGSDSVAAPWGDMPFYIDPANDASAYARRHPTVAGSALIAREGQTAVADWFGDWNDDVQADAESYVSGAAAVHAMPVLVAYNIPNRDCGGYSAGGLQTATDYANWIQKLANGIGGKPAVVILEPDALADLDCLTGAARQARVDMLAGAVTTLKANSHTHVYIDAGNAKWQPAATIATWLKSVNIAKADGFSLNVSNFLPTNDTAAYGTQVSQLVGGKHFLIDTSRNGNGMAPNDDWCNPPGRALGALPTVHTGNGLTDGWVWVKDPWESDGPCNGGPAAGDYFWTYGVQLAQNAGW